MRLLVHNVANRDPRDGIAEAGGTVDGSPPTTENAAAFRPVMSQLSTVPVPTVPAPTVTAMLVAETSPDVPPGWIAVRGDEDHPGSLVRVRSKRLAEPSFRGYAKRIREMTESVATR